MQVRQGLPHHRWVPWLILLQVVILYAPTLSWLIDRWTLDVWHHGHGILITPIVAYLIWQELRTRRDLPRSANPWGFAFLIPSLALHMLDSGINSQLLAAASLFLSLPGFSLLFLGTERTKAIAFLLLILFLTLPIPLAFTESLHLLLRRIATDGSSALLQLFDIPVYSHGTTLEVPNGVLQVADACSGFSTLYASVTLALLVAYFCQDKRRRVLVLLVAAPLAVGVNILRVMLLALLVYWFGIDVLHTSLHQISGLLTFAISLPIIFWLGQSPSATVNNRS